ncbi:forkhead box protein G1-like [Rhinatrema bivittatum]|uniref:forkhead box protein G1-like n=1 Tax=Rhinatrema bivittatum TaxID=194408 RepID=UPI00112D0A6C|nr:forkhead box protein G1-like [Rhinatrema bivittatum]
MPVDQKNMEALKKRARRIRKEEPDYLRAHRRQDESSSDGDGGDPQHAAPEQRHDTSEEEMLLPILPPPPPPHHGPSLRDPSRPSFPTPPPISPAPPDNQVTPILRAIAGAQSLLVLARAPAGSPPPADHQ